MTPVTDPAILSQLNGPSPAPAGLSPVTDPSILAQLNAPGPSTLESVARGAGNNFPLLPQAISALEPGEYSGNLSDWNAKAAAAKAAHPVAYGAGAVAGAAAPLAIPGVGEALEAAPVLGNAALGAASAISNTDLTRSPDVALKQAGEGALLGGAVGGIANKLLPSAEGLTAGANRTAIKSLNLPSGMLVDMSPEERTALAEFSRANGLVGRNKEEALSQARALSDKFGAKIGEIGDTSESMGLHVDPDEHYSAINTLLEKADQYSGLQNREAKGLARNYSAGANDILSLPANPSWSDIQELKNQYGPLAFKPNGEVKDEAAKDTYFALKDMLNGIAKKAQGDPNLAPEYKEALAGYTQMHPIVGGLEKTVDSELKGHQGTGGFVFHPGRMLAQLPGGARATLGAAATVMGHPYLGAAAALPEIMNPAMQSKALAAAANAAPLARQAVSRELGDFLDSKYGSKPPDNPTEQLSSDGILKATQGTPYAGAMQQAAQRGPQAVVANHFVLMQRDPKYNEAFTNSVQGQHPWIPPNQ